MGVKYYCIDTRVANADRLLTLVETELDYPLCGVQQERKRDLRPVGGGGQFDYGIRMTVGVLFKTIFASLL